MTLDDEGMEAIRASQGLGTVGASESISGRAAARKPEEADQDGAEADRSVAPFVVHDAIVIP